MNEELRLRHCAGCGFEVVEFDHIEQYHGGKDMFTGGQSGTQAWTLIGEATLLLDVKKVAVVKLPVYLRTAFVEQYTSSSFLAFYVKRETLPSFEIENVAAEFKVKYLDSAFREKFLDSVFGSDASKISVWWKHVSKKR